MDVKHETARTNSQTEPRKFTKLLLFSCFRINIFSLCKKMLCCPEFHDLHLLMCPGYKKWAGLKFHLTNDKPLIKLNEKWEEPERQ